MPSQRDFGIRLGWGVNAVRGFAADCAVVVIVDVLCFSTTVEVAVSRGATVLPHRMGDDSAAGYAAERDASLAVGRGEETPDRPFSLSPVSMEAAGRGDRVVLPSPNGATLCIAAAAGDAAVIAGCLRNAPAVAAAAARHRGPIGVVAAGERWADGSMRPALEDLLGAGAIVAAAPSKRTRSPEASAGAAALQAAMPDVAAAVADSVSGRELRQRGNADDVTVASEYDVSETVPVMEEGAFSG